MTMTALETKILLAVLNSEYHDATPKAQRAGNPIWRDCVARNHGEAGVMASLIKKGLIYHANDECVALSKEGLEAALAAEKPLSVEAATRNTRRSIAAIFETNEFEITNGDVLTAANGKSAFGCAITGLGEIKARQMAKLAEISAVEPVTGCHDGELVLLLVIKL